MYPNITEYLIIPTQHNEIIIYGDYAGAEIDCRASAFNRKVQILIHFNKTRLCGAQRLFNMIAHTRRYRATQLNDFLDSFTNQRYEKRLHEAADKTGVESDIIRFARIQATKLQKLIQLHTPNIPEFSIKNKLFINYLNSQKNITIIMP